MSQLGRLSFEIQLVLKGLNTNANNASWRSRCGFKKAFFFGRQLDRLFEQAQPMVIGANEPQTNALDDVVAATRHRDPLPNHFGQRASPIGNVSGGCRLCLLPSHHPVSHRDQREASPPSWSSLLFFHSYVDRVCAWARGQHTCR